MKRLFLVIFLAVSLLASRGLAGANHTLADTTKGAIQAGACGASGNTDCSPQAAGNNLEQTISNVVNLLSTIGGIAAVIMIIVGGLRYTSSAGNADAAKNAKNTILYAVVGLVIVALAQLIVHFVLHTTIASTDCVNGKTSTGQKC